jgi:hypothetical protein
VNTRTPSLLDPCCARSVVRRTSTGENGFTYGLLHQQQPDAGRLHEGDIIATWRNLRRKVRDLAA